MHALAAAFAVVIAAQAQPLRLLPDNPQYFEFRGRPTVLMTSGEHYGAVLNRDFDAAPYLDELKSRGFNLTRTFSGTYFEIPGSFNIRDNTLAPKAGRYIGPWARSGDKYDLDRFDDAYFERLKAFVTAAAERGIVVEYVLFCPFYEDALWAVNPMNARNNVNGVGKHSRDEVYTLRHPELLARQLAFVRKAVSELNGFDNVYFEICNEPYAGTVTGDWQAKVASTIVDTEKGLPRKHLIAQNIANEKAEIRDPNPAVSIFNFHYATPPVTVAMNARLNRPIADDETGFRGHDDRAYRTEAWEFFLAGGGAFSNLDYSFTTDHEDGSAKVTDPTPGGGGPSLRAQLTALKRELDAFDLAKTGPHPEIVKAGAPSGVTPYALAEPGRRYLIYARQAMDAKLTLELPEGGYDGRWIDPRTGRELATIDFAHSGGIRELAAPGAPEDIALSLVARNP